MMRVLSLLFALFALATAGKTANRKSRGRTVMPSPDQYMVEGQTLVQPGGVFEINGVIDEPVVNPSSCPVTTRFFGDSRIYFDQEKMTGKFVVHVMVFSDEGIAEIVESRGDITFQDSQLSIGTFTVPETGVTYQIGIGLGIFVRPVIDGYYCAGISMLLADDGGNYLVLENLPGSFMGIENFAIKQTKSGGFKITTTIYMVESDVPDGFVGSYNDKKVAVQTTTFETTSTGSLCAKDVVDVFDASTAAAPTTTVPSGRISSGGVGKPNKKNGQNPTRNGVCDSFSAFFLQYASKTPVGSLATQLAFSGEFKVYDKHGRKTKKTFQIGVISQSATEDTWRVALVDLDGADPLEPYVTGAPTMEYLATRVATGTSDLSYLYLKHNELAKGGNKAFKQAQKSAGYQVGLNGQNSVKDNRIIASSFEDDFKKDKPRSWKKNTKNKKTNRRRRRRNKKAAGWRDQLGN